MRSSDLPTTAAPQWRTTEVANHRSGEPPQWRTTEVRETSSLICCLFGLSTPEVYLHNCCQQCRGLLPRVFTLSAGEPKFANGGIFSVALSVNVRLPLRRLPVRKQGALCCPDFPRDSTEAPSRDRADCFVQK